MPILRLPVFTTSMNTHQSLRCTNTHVRHLEHNQSSTSPSWANQVPVGPNLGNWPKHRSDKQAFHDRPHMAQGLLVLHGTLGYLYQKILRACTSCCAQMMPCGTRTWCGAKVVIRMRTAQPAIRWGKGQGTSAGSATRRYCSCL